MSADGLERHSLERLAKHFNGLGHEGGPPVLVYRYRAQVWVAKGDYRRAAADYRTSLRIDPTDADSHNSLAWMLATCSSI